MFGISLTQNFNVPYFSQSLTNIWQRWHISLSNWLRDYIFMPITRFLMRRKLGNRHIISIILPSFATMLFSGLWHGLSINMLYWGGLHGLFQVVERVIALRWPPSKEKPVWRRIISSAVTSFFFMLAFTPFWMKVPFALRLWRKVFSLNAWQAATPEMLTLPGFFYIVIAVLILLSLFIDILENSKGELGFKSYSSLSKALLINLAVWGIFIAATISAETPPPFIYQGF